MKILIDIGHPGHVHYFRNFIKKMEENLHEVLIVARDKEVTFKLLEFYKIPYRTREPYRLPTLKFVPCPITGIDMEYQSIAQFQIENYESHPTIKAPLSN